MEAFFAADLSIAILVVILVIAVLRLGIKVVPQSEVFDMPHPDGFFLAPGI